MTTTITLETILETLTDMDYISDESLEKFQTHVSQNGFDDETLRLFAELLEEEINERNAEISAGEETIQETNDQISALDEKSTEELEKMKKMVEDTFQSIGNDAEKVYGQIAQDTFNAIRDDQKSQDDAKAAAIKESIGL